MLNLFLKKKNKKKLRKKNYLKRNYFIQYYSSFFLQHMQVTKNAITTAHGCVQLGQ